MVKVLRWTDGTGWIVLSGGADAGSEIRAHALQIAKSEGGVAYLGLNEDSADETLDDMEDLGAPTGYLVNVVAEDDDTIHKQLSESSVLVIDNHETAETWRNVLLGAAVNGMQTALANGAIILAEGTAAMALGRWIPSDDDDTEFRDGLAWVQNTLILPGITSLQGSFLARAMLEQSPDAIVIGIGVGSALALGAEGQIEVWGERQVAIALGRNYQ
ncbi:MAG: hypothetical protein MUF87_00865 [Anaerolineae bacterium]|jgi:hypothetical protein|nr:hypothetical protein [Anaerolineae bacterium]